jgi:shikimate dehydrogenase
VTGDGFCDAPPPVALTGRARIAGVVGWPVDHSLSPRLHGFWLRAYRTDGAYVPLPVRPADLEDALAALPKLGFAGVNVTVPHKERALAVVDRVTPEARRIGAVNTIVVDADGRLVGSDTDAFGFGENLRQAGVSWQAAHGPAVLIGAGGAARAVAVALADDGVPEIRLINRTRPRAEDLAATIEAPITIVDWRERAAALDGAALVVNATILGMRGQPPLDLPLDFLSPAALVTDIVYTPLVTPLLAAAQARGNPVVDGLGMLLHQARPGFRAWFGRDPAVTAELRHFVAEALSGR